MFSSKMLRYLLAAALSLAPLPIVDAQSAGWLPLARAGAGGGPLSFVWKSSTAVIGTPAPSATLASMDIGTASSDRIVVVAVSWKGTASASMDIPSNGVTINGVTANQGAYLRGTNSRATAIYWALVTAGSGVQSIGVQGYSNGFIDEIMLNVGTITGSATATNPSNITSVPPGYSSGTTGQAITIPASGVSVICALSDNSGFAPTSTFTNATLDKDQYDGATFGITGSMAHATASATVTMGTNSGSTTGWVASNFQP